MKLELIHHAAEKQPEYQTPLLFVHGGWHGAWCWEKNFMPYFARRGYTSYAVSLEGHGKSEGKVSSASLSDFVANVGETVDRIYAEKMITPVLIGHSMGGIVSLLYASGTGGSKISALGLLAPAWNTPGPGIIPQTFTILRAAPLRNLGAFLKREWYPPPSSILFGEQSAHYHQRLTNESLKALMQLIRLHASNSLSLPASLPTLFTAGGIDRTISEKDVRLLHQIVKHGDYRNYPDATHDVMLNPNIWQKIASDIAEWLDSVLQEK